MYENGLALKSDTTFMSQPRNGSRLSRLEARRSSSAGAKQFRRFRVNERPASWLYSSVHSRVNILEPFPEIDGLLSQVVTDRE